MKPFDLFKQYIQGDLDNREQVEAERLAGEQLHPFARHVNRVADEKILNKPANYDGFYILEESYYTYAAEATSATEASETAEAAKTIVKPYLFWFTEEQGRVKLHSMRLPEHIPVQEIRNDNAELRIDFAALVLSPSFTPAFYDFDEATQSFRLHAPNPFPGGVFTLEETIGPDGFSVMERLVKDGKLLTPYSTPIEYKRRLS
jgi:hypothetical protein